MKVLKNSSGARRALFWVTLLLVLSFFAFPGVAKEFSRTTSVLIGIFSIEMAMLYMRKFIGASSHAAMLTGLIWVNAAWIWWIFLFTGLRSIGGYVKGSSSRNAWIRRSRVRVKQLIRFASERSQSKHMFVRGMKCLVDACHKDRVLLVLLFIFAGIVPHADVAAIFIAVTFHFPILITMSCHRVVIFQLPRLVIWTILAMNSKILLLAWMLQ